MIIMALLTFARRRYVNYKLRKRLQKELDVQFGPNLRVKKIK